MNFKLINKLRWLASPWELAETFSHPQKKISKEKTHTPHKLKSMIYSLNGFKNKKVAEAKQSFAIEKPQLMFF